MPYEYTSDGYWLPPEPGGTPGWGGVRHFACRSCSTITDYFITTEAIKGNGRPPRFCRKCLLEGKRPAAGAVAEACLEVFVNAQALGTSGIEQVMRRAFAKEQADE